MQRDAGTEVSGGETFVPSSLAGGLLDRHRRLRIEMTGRRARSGRRTNPILLLPHIKASQIGGWQGDLGV